MKYSILQKEKKLVITPENLDDLWIVQNIIQNSDIVSGKTTRRFRIENSKDSEKKTVFVKIQAEKKELDVNTHHLKVSGIIVDGNPIDYIDVGSYHTLDIDEGSIITIEKEEFLGYERDFLESAKKHTLAPKIVAIILDDEVAKIVELNYGNYRTLARVISKNKGKRYQVEDNKEYYKEIFGAINTQNPEFIIVAGPGFEKEKLSNYLKEKTKHKITQVGLNSTGTSGTLELINSKSLSNILSEFKISKDLEKVNEILYKISKDKKDLIYGKKPCFEILLSQISAVEEMIISTNFFNDNFTELKPNLLRLTSQNSKIHLIDSTNDAGKLLDGLGGIVFNLYYPI